VVLDPIMIVATVALAVLGAVQLIGPKLSARYQLVANGF
jgi:hypothetical protein